LPCFSLAATILPAPLQLIYRNSWRLVIGPGHALRYVVIHELIHIRHHNHSRAFWAALTEAMPDWKKSADWLRANERLLTAYRPRI